MINFLDKDQVIMTRSIESYKKWRISSFLSQKKYELEDVMDVSPNGKQILSSGEEGLGLKLSDAKTMQLLFKTYKEFNKPIVFAKFNYNGNHFIVGCKEKVISLWETKNLKKIQILNAHTAEVNCAVFSHNCLLVASGSADKTIILWYFIFNFYKHKLIFLNFNL